ncbi:MAG: helix-turn-helix domain-containing protein [Cumulibacter sp.]
MSATVVAPEIGMMLREWRERRRLSQQDLSNLTTVSTRHLSRVETGKARPTPKMILHLAENLEVPLRQRNQLLLAAGYAPKFADTALNDPSLSVVMAGLRDLLDAHLPYPALLLDDYWELVDANAAVDALLSGFAPELLEPPVNVVRLSVHPAGLAGRIKNLDQWATHLHHQVLNRTARSRDPRHRELAREITDLRGEVPRAEPTGEPVLAMQLEVAGQTLRMYSVAAQLSTAWDVALEGLHLETFLPADDATRAFFSTDGK